MGPCLLWAPASGGPLGFSLVRRMDHATLRGFLQGLLKQKSHLELILQSIKSMETNIIIFPIIYNRCNVDIGKIMKEEWLNM